MTARPVYPRGRKSVRKTPYFHALGIVVEWKQRNDKSKLNEVQDENSYNMWKYEICMRNA